MTTAMLERPAKPCGCTEAGIGQKVKIMAGIGHSAAGRSSQSVHIQEGTGKSSLGRSSQSVHIRGEVEACKCGITDTFTRTEGPDDWGTSDADIPWIIAGGSAAHTVSVDGSRGLMALDFATATTGGVFIQFPEIGLVPFDVRLTVQLSDIPPSGGRFVVEMMGDWQNLNFFLLPAADLIGILNGDFTTGIEEVAFSPTWTDPISLHIRKEIVGGLTTLSGNAWQGGDEPVGWMCQDTDGGHIDTTTLFGLAVEQLGGSPFESHMAAAVDDLDITGLVSMCMFDDFNRTESGQFGNASSSGQPWTTWSSSGGGALSYGCDGASLFAAASGADAFVGAHVSPPGPWTEPNWRVKYRFRPVGGLGSVLYFRVIGDNCQLNLAVFMDNVGGQYSIDDYQNSWHATVVKLDWVLDQWYIYEAIAQNEVGGQVRVYAEGDPIPPYESFVYDDVYFTGFDASCVLDVIISPIPDGARVEVDYIKMCPIVTPEPPVC